MYILIDNYDSFTHIIKHYLESNQVDVEIYRNDEIKAIDILNKKPTGIIISPGPKTPDDAGVCIDLINLVSKKIPILGICLGHQSIAQAYGAKIIKAKKIMHGKISKIYHNKKSIFKDMPQNFKATRYHSLIVEKETLPKNILITSESSDGYIMSIEITKARVFGLQFHPESYDTELGNKLITNFIKICER